jgi:hypothetical protein
MPIVAVSLGSFIPDFMMFVFYGFHKVVGTPEKTIWSQSYFEPSWQLSFDVFNSIPIILVMLAAAYFFKNKFLWYLSIGMLLHVLADLPLHHDDGHRHFLPFSNYRFVSPLSYWDPMHHGREIALLEIVSVLFTGIYLWLKNDSAPMRWASGSTVLMLVAGISYALYAWVL